MALHFPRLQSGGQLMWPDQNRSKPSSGFKMFEMCCLLYLSLSYFPFDVTNVTHGPLGKCSPVTTEQQQGLFVQRCFIILRKLRIPLYNLQATGCMPRSCKMWHVSVPVFPLQVHQNHQSFGELRQCVHTLVAVDSLLYQKHCIKNVLKMKIPKVFLWDPWEKWT